MTHAYFVVGTDTGVGKTTISCMLLRTYAAQGVRVVGMKPVASGCQRVGERLVSEDVACLQAAGNVQAPADSINPYAFEPPLAPHIAAARVGSEIRLEKIAEAFKKLQAIADIVIVEGVGGFRVPLNARQDTADLAVELGLPVILVIGLRLGCINHALLTVDAIRQRGLTLAGWVANSIDPDMDAIEENLVTLDALIPAPRLAFVGYQKKAEMRESTALPDIVLAKIGRQTRPLVSGG